MQLNAVGNRVKGRVLAMADAHRCYARSTEIDPWEGTFTFDPATGRTGGDDTGSSGLASCKAAQEQGLGGSYYWVFGGADAVVQNIMDGRVVSIGTWWTESMFDLDADGRVVPAGEIVGGHQYAARGYDARRDWVLCRCWWGDTFRDFWISREDLHRLLMDGGDAHWQMSA